MGFGLLRTSFASALETYQQQARKHARDTLHILFFVPRGADNGAIRKDIATRIDAMHEMLGLVKGQALIDATHPVYGEYPAPVGGGPLRFFPVDGKDGTTIAKPVPGSQTHHFVEALGKSVA